MCGIVGAIAQRDVVPVLIEGLKRLEYRGYDSSGIAVLEQAAIGGALMGHHAGDEVTYETPTGAKITVSAPASVSASAWPG